METTMQHSGIVRIAVEEGKDPQAEIRGFLPTLQNPELFPGVSGVEFVDGIVIERADIDALQRASELLEEGVQDETLAARLALISGR